MENQEIEVKYYVDDLGPINTRLNELGAVLVQERVLETNLRFDTPDGRLARAFQVLRLRKDTQARMTYKGPSQSNEGARIREEIEFVVEDFDRATVFLKALGFQVILVYEKFRTIYDFEDVHVTLDEMPFGNFVELEGPEVATIQSVNQKLGLAWELAVPASYTMLFEQLKQRKSYQFRDLTFKNFEELEITSSDLGVLAADVG